MRSQICGPPGRASARNAGAADRHGSDPQVRNSRRSSCAHHFGTHAGRRTLRWPVGEIIARRLLSFNQEGPSSCECQRTIDHGRLDTQLHDEVELYFQRLLRGLQSLVVTGIRLGERLMQYLDLPVCAGKCIVNAGKTTDAHFKSQSDELLECRASRQATRRAESLNPGHCHVVEPKCDMRHEPSIVTTAETVTVILYAP